MEDCCSTSQDEKNSFEWNAIAEEAFQMLKLAMTKALVIYVLDFFFFFKSLLIVMLLSWHWCYFIAGQTHSIFLSSTPKQESASINLGEGDFSFGLRSSNMEVMLARKTFLVRTNHQSLKHLWTQKINIVAQQRWLCKLMSYDFLAEYKKGGENMVADALSRQLDMEPSNGSLFSLTQLLPHWLEAIKDEMTNQPSL